MKNSKAATHAARPLTEQDLERRNYRLQLFVLRQLVLRLYVDMYGEAACSIVRNNLALIRDASGDATRHPAEQSLLFEETVDVLAEYEEHADLIHAGAL